MRRRIETTKKTISRAISFVLALMVLVSSLPYVPLVTNAAITNPGVTTSQTGFNDVLEYQKAKWQNILDNTFVQKITSVPSINNVKSNNIRIKSDSTYFNWHTFSESDGVTAWDGKRSENMDGTIDVDGKTYDRTTTETIIYPEQSVPNGDGSGDITASAVTVVYTVYNVSNASELRYAIEQAQNSTTNSIKINLLNDIDLNGQESFWDPIIFKDNKLWINIEGNGHTIYNMKTHSNGYAAFIGSVTSNKRFIMKNLNFSNCLVFSTDNRNSVVIGQNAGKVYLENVNIKNSFVYSSSGNTGTLIGRTQTTSGNSFIRNCSSSNCYVYGTMHSGGLTGCQHNQGTYSVKYDVAFPNSPETWLNKTQIFPQMFENCYSVDCEMYSTDTQGDSGAFISCGVKMICRNCFTNNIIYGNQRTGAFFGRITTYSGSVAPGLYDDGGNLRVNIYFENCYASGSVEGNSKIGGFLALDNNQSGGGVAVYKNCYTTAMVGMDYSGSQLGGFIGLESSANTKAKIEIGKDANGNALYNYKPGTTEIQPGAVYINCYAAGEVGNILTDTSTTSSDNNKIGGFVGEIGFYDSEYASSNHKTEYDINSTFVNCYYDMQTTAMRERAAGKPDQFYLTDLSSVDNALNSTSALSEEQKNNLIKLKNNIENNADKNYNVDLTPIDNALDLITDEQKKALLELKEQILSKDSSADVSAINDVLGIVNYKNSNKYAALSNVQQELQAIKNKSPNMNIISTINALKNCSSTSTDPNVKSSKMSSDNIQALKQLEDNIKSLIDSKLLPSNLNYSDISDVYGRITSDEKTNLGLFQNSLNTILSDTTKRESINSVLKNILKEKDDTLDNDTLSNMSQDELDEKSGFTNMCTALDLVVNAEEDTLIENVKNETVTDVNTELIRLREVLIDAGLFNNDNFQSIPLTYIAHVTTLVTQTKKDTLNTLKNKITSYYPNPDITILQTILNNTNLLTDEQKVGLINLKSSLNANAKKQALSDYLGTEEYKNILSVIDDLLYSISEDEKTALLKLKDNVSALGIDTSVIDEVVKADDTNVLTDEEKQALQEMKSETLKYASQIPGVTGVYTQSSKAKGIAGLAGSVDGGETIDMGDTDAWQNDQKQDMYPALKVFYDESIIKSHFGTMNISGTKKITQTTTGEDGNETTETINSDLYDDDTKARIQTQLNKKQEIVKQYCVASVSTVLLNHWDSAMNIDTGNLSGETGWVCGLDQNKLEKAEYSATDRWNKDTDGYYWTRTYTNLAAGSYEFKIQQGESWAYNFGSDKFNGANCVLNVPQDCNVNINFDYVPYVSQTGADTNFRIWADFYDKDNNQIGSQELGKNINDISQGVFSAVGSFSDWKVESTDYDLYYIGNGQYSNKIKPLHLTTGSYEFKIAKDHSWSVSYGISGKSNNMSFTLTQESDVIITFNEDTHLTTLESTVAGALQDVKLEEEKVDYPEYSLIGSSDITGYDWLASPQAVLDGEMQETTAGSGIYTKTYTLTSDKFDKVYGYKVIKNGVDTGIRNYYTINPLDLDITIKSVTLIFKYDSSTDATTIEYDKSNFEIKKPTVNFYGVLGGDKLTGYNWGQIWDDTEKIYKFVYLNEENDKVYGTYEDGYLGATGRMTSSTDSNGNTIWSITYNDVPEGEHSFKVAGNSMWQSGIDYGSNLDGGNYTISLTQTADVTITFNETTKHISVKTNPENALYQEKYVVCGNTNLTGESKSTTSTDNEMTLDNETGLYTKTYDNIKSDQNKNYSFKIVRYGTNNTNQYDAFTIYSDEVGDTETYKIVITYNTSSKETVCKVLNSRNEDVTASVKKPANVEFYAVAGDKALTGFNWLADSFEDTMNACRMQYNETEKKHEVTLYNVTVEPTASVLSFKVVANGTWDSGIDYGKPNGDNYIITLQSNDVTSCNVTIKFDEATQEISVSATDNCLSEIDENKFEWFVCGVYNLVSDDIYNTPKTVYDTVRDITAEFSFTAEENMDWSKSFVHNTENNFFNKLNNNVKDESGEKFDDLSIDGGFDIDYHVQNKDITGHFNVPCIDLKSEVDADTNITQYSCSTFMAGKQWVGVSAAKDKTSDIKGKRYLRLIPTAYLEAGMDANINVLQASSDIDEQHVYNLVSYNNNSKYNSFNIKNSDNTTSTFDSNTYFSRYNFALTSSYAITDINGIGYYGNYSQQIVQKYDKNKVRENVLNERQYSGSDSSNPKPYFVMTSAFAQKASYTDLDTNGNQATDSNLKIDEIQDQALIGTSYGTAKTIVKVYKGNSKVFMSTDSTKKDYYDNYLKWTGQKAFDSEDAGTYTVKYFWSLADGRYLSDTKSVTITTNKYDIKKTVDKNCIDKNDTSNDGKELTYTVTYTNHNAGSFKICDILPFDNDVRYDEHSAKGVSNSKMDRSSFTLKSISVNSVYTTDENGEPLTDGNGNSITAPNTDAELGLYYTTETKVQSYLYNDTDETRVPTDNVADRVQDENGNFNYDIWTQVSGALSSPVNVNVYNATALFITGKQTKAGVTKTTLTYTVEVSNPANCDSYINNAFFSADNDISIQADLAVPPMILGYSQPTKTAVINRSVSGYVWYDLNFDGKYNTSTEPPIENVKVVLMKMNEEGTYSETRRSLKTDENGYYEFDDLITGEYKVCFMPVENEQVTIKYSSLDSTKTDKQVDFDQNTLTLSKRLANYQSEQLDNSRNITKSQTKEDGAVDYYYIDESMPTTSLIYNNNNSQRFQGGTVKDGYFSKEFQNMALKPVLTNENCSLTVKKIDSETGKPLKDVKFKLEYQPSSSEEEEENYQQIYVERIMNTDNTVKEYKFVEKIPGTDETNPTTYKYAYDTGSPDPKNVIPADSIATDSNGMIKFKGLPSDALYNLSEVATLDDYNMLPNGVKFNLPYYIGKTAEEGKTVISDDGYISADGTGQGGYYKDITYTITNSKIPNMPLTGVGNNFSPIVIAFVLLSIGIVIFIAYKIYKSKKSV